LPTSLARRERGTPPRKDYRALRDPRVFRDFLVKLPLGLLSPFLFYPFIHVEDSGG